MPFLRRALALLLTLGLLTGCGAAEPAAEDGAPDGTDAPAAAVFFDGFFVHASHSPCLDSSHGLRC